MSQQNQVNQQAADKTMLDRLLERDATVPKWRKSLARMVAIIDEPTAIDMYQQYLLRRYLLNSSHDNSGSLAVCIIYITVILVIVAIAISGQP